MIMKNFKPYLALAEDVIADVSNSFAELIEYKAEEIIGQEVFHLLNNMLRLSPMTARLEDVLSNQIYYIFTKQREYREVRIALYKDGDINYLAFKEIPGSRIEVKFPYLQQQIQDNFYGLALFSAEDLTLLKANEKYKDIMKRRYESTDIVGRKIYEFIIGWDESPTRQAWLQTISTGKSYKVYEYMSINPFTGEEEYVDRSITPLKIDDQVKYLIIMLNDVTEKVLYRKQNEEQQRLLFEAEKQEKDNLERVINMKDEFLSLISHEFKTPLTVISSALQTMDLICRKELSPKANMFLDKIRQNTYRQLRLVNNLLDITRANAGHVKLIQKNVDIVFITRAIVESVRVYAQQKGVHLHFVSDIKHKIIAIDEEKYERVILNLLSNSIKFTPEGKKITVKISQKSGMLQIEVKDQGIGIPIEKQGIIFERFGQVDSSFTRHAEGSGIGLYLVKLLVEAFSGHISLKSEVDKGSTFCIMLPITDVIDPIEAEEDSGFIDSRLVQAIAIEFSDIYF